MKKIKLKIKKPNKKIVISISLVLIVFLTSFIYYNLTRPTKLNKIYAHIINKGAPANKYFDDEIFYNAVVDAYNEENKTNLPYTTNLTDNQLSTLTSLYCDGDTNGRIISISGVEKLTSLSTLTLYDNKITDINLSQNSLLKLLRISEYKLTNLDLSKNDNLEELQFSNGNIKSLDLSNHTALKKVLLGCKNLEIVNLHNDTSLEYLVGIEQTKQKLSNIDIEGCTSLLTLSLPNANINSIDLSTNVNLQQLCLGRNILENITLTNNHNLELVDISYNNLKNIDLTYNANLKILSLGHNYLKNLNINNNTLLEELYIDRTVYSYSIPGGVSTTNQGYYDEDDNNDISSIDLSHNIMLKVFNVPNNSLKNIDLSPCNSLTEFTLYNNELSYIKLPDNYDLNNVGNMKGQNTKQLRIDYGNNKLIEPINDYNLYVGHYILIPQSVPTEDFINNLGLSNLTVKVYDSETEKNSGNIEYGDTVKIYDGGIELQDLSIYIFSNNTFDDWNLYRAVIDAYNDENNTNLDYTSDLTDEQLATISVLRDNATNVLPPYKIRSTRGIEKLLNLKNLSLIGDKISKIDLSHNSALTDIELEGNSIATIDLTHNTELQSLNLSKNNIEEIDLSNNKSLINLDLSENNLESIDLTHNTELQSLNLSKNNIEEIDLTHNTPRLGSLDLSQNKLSSIDLGHANWIIKLYLWGNNLESIDLTNIGYILQLSLSDNELTSIDLSHTHIAGWANLSNNNLSNIKLMKGDGPEELYLRNNNLNAIDLSQYTNIEKLGIDGNPITENIYLSVDEEFDGYVIMPNETEEFNTEYKIENSDIAKYENNKLKALSIGNTKYNLTIDNAGPNHNEFELDGNIIVYDLASEVYDLSKDYIYSVNNSFDISKIDAINCSIKEENNKLIVYSGEDIIRTYDIININLESSKYDLSKDYIYLGTNEFDSSKIESTNITYEEKNNNLYLKYNDEVIKIYKLIKVSSIDYDLNKGYALVINNKLDSSKISVTNGSLELNNNKINIKYNEEVIDTFDIASISSDKYNLTSNYLYLLNEEVDLNKITTINCNVKVEDDKLIVYKDENILKSLDIVGINYSSSDYDLSKKYIYLGTDNFDSSKIESSNITFEVKDNILNLKHENDILKQYKLIKISSTKYNLNKEYIYVGNNTLNTNDITITNGTLEVSNNKLNIKYQDELLDSYKIAKVSSEIYDLGKDNIRLGKNEEFNIENVSTINCEKEYSDDKLYIKYGEDILKTYTVSNRAPGDITGDDEIDLRDVIKLFRHYRKKAIIEDEETLAMCDITGDSEIDLRDVIKLFRYYRGKIPTLD